MKERRLITSSPFDIPDRVRELDENYRLYYNVKTRKIELHNLRVKPTFQLVLPYSQLDSRAVDYIMRTRLDKIIADIEGIDDYNKCLEDKIINRTLDELHTKTKNIIDYMNRGGSQIPSYSEL